MIMADITYIYLKCTRNEIFAPLKKSGSRKTMVTSDFRPNVEIWPFRVFAMKNIYVLYFASSAANNTVFTVKT